MRRVQCASINPFGEERGSRRRQGPLLTVIRSPWNWRLWPMPPFSARKMLIMRSEIALASLLTKNHFELCHQVFKIVRKFHKPGNRVQDTATDAIQRLAGVEQQRGSIAPDNANDSVAIEVGLEQSA